MASPMITSPICQNAGFFALNGMTYSYRMNGNQLQILNSDGSSVLILDGTDAVVGLGTIKACGPA